MAVNRDVKVTLVGEDKASKTFDKVGNKSDGLAGKFGKLGPAAKAGVAGMATALLTTGGMAFIEMSSRLEAMGAKAEVVFGKELGSVQKWAKTSAGAMKLTQSEAVGLATNMADLLIPMGFGRDIAAKMSTETIGLAGALSKWSGGTVSSADAANILTDAMLGETDGLKALGISISAAEIDARLLKNGQDKLTGAAKAQAEAQATQALVFEKSTDAQAGFVSGSKTLQDRLDGVKVKMREATEQLVVKLTPAAERFADWVSNEGVAALSRFGDWLQRNKQGFIDFGVGALTGIAVVTGGLALLVEAVWHSFGAIVRAAATAFGWVPGIGEKLKGAERAFTTMKDTAVTSLKTASSTAQGLADKLAGIKSKEITVTVRERLIRSAGLRDSAVAERGIGVPAARNPAARPVARPAAGRSRTNQSVVVNVGGRTVARAVNEQNAGRAARGARVVSVP